MKTRTIQAGLKMPYGGLCGGGKEAQHERARFLAQQQNPFDLRPGKVNVYEGLRPEQLRNAVVIQTRGQAGNALTAFTPKKAPWVLPPMPSRPLPQDDAEQCLWLAEFHEKAGNHDSAARCYAAAAERTPQQKRYREPAWLRFLRWVVR